MKHRHLDIAPGTRVEDLPSAALVDILERGDLDDWRPVAAGVARDPWGELAGRVSHLIDAYPMYGTSALWRAWIDRCRARAEGPPRGLAPSTLADLRRRCGLTQAELARRLGISQSDLSKLERRRDVRLSTLRALAAALDGRLRVLVERRGESTEIRIEPDPEIGGRSRPAAGGPLSA